MTSAVCQVPKTNGDVSNKRKSATVVVAKPESEKKKPRRVELQPCTLPFARLVDDEVIDPEDVEVIPQSKLAPAIGKAVVARRDFQSGDTICSYGGDIITEQQLDDLHRKHERGSPRVSYVVALDEKLSVDGFPGLSSSRGHVGNYINDARGIAGAETNCMITMIEDTDYNKIVFVVIVATKEIKNGDELWLDYGKDYWGKN